MINQPESIDSLAHRYMGERRETRGSPPMVEGASAPNEVAAGAPRLPGPTLESTLVDVVAQMNAAGLTTASNITWEVAETVIRGIGSGLNSAVWQGTAIEIAMDFFAWVAAPGLVRLATRQLSIPELRAHDQAEPASAGDEAPPAGHPWQEQRQSLTAFLYGCAFQGHTDIRELTGALLPEYLTFGQPRFGRGAFAARKAVAETFVQWAPASVPEFDEARARLYRLWIHRGWEEEAGRRPGSSHSEQFLNRRSAPSQSGAVDDNHRDRQGAATRSGSFPVQGGAQRVGRHTTVCACHGGNSRRGA